MKCPDGTRQRRLLLSLATMILSFCRVAPANGGNEVVIPPDPNQDARAKRLFVLPVQRREAGADEEGKLIAGTLKVPLEEVAFITQHLWNDSTPEGPPVPDHLMIGMGTRANTRRAQEIDKQVILPALEAARRAGITVVHSQPAFIAHRYAQYKKLVAEMSGEPAEPVWPAPDIPQYTEKEMAEWTVGTWPGWGQMDFPRELAPLPTEPVTVRSEELDHVLKKRGVTTLIYVGYATDMCLVGYSGGLNDMVHKFGYQACVLREATLATELGPDDDGPQKTIDRLRKIERDYASTASATDFMAAVEPLDHLSFTLNGLEIGLDKNSGALVSLSYPATGVALRTMPEDGGILDVAYPVECFIPMRLASRHSKARIEPSDDGVTLIYDALGPSRTHCPLPEGKVTARVNIRAADDARSIILSCSIENRSKGSIPQVLFPDLRGLRPFAGVQGTQLRLTNNVAAPFTGEPRPTQGAPFYGFQDGWRVFEYGGYYGPHVLRWMDLGGHKGGLSLFEKQWGGTNIPSLLLQRRELDPESLRLAWEHRVTIAPEQTWTSSEFWLTPHPGGWAKGIEVFRDYVDQVNPRRAPPRRIREALGLQTIWLIQPMETDPQRAAFTYKDLARVARDAKAHGIDEICVWGAFRAFHLPLELETGPGTKDEFLQAVRAAREIGVGITPFVSIALLTGPSLQPYGITGVAPAWVYHPELIRNMDPYYQKAGYPVLGWEIGGAPLGDERYQKDALQSFQTWIDAGVTSWGWDVVCSKGADGAKTPVLDLLGKLRAAARAADPESVLCGELVPNGSLEYDNQLIDYIWCWVPFTEPEPMMNVLGAPRFGPTLEDHAIEVKKAFAAGLYMNLLPRKPDQPNGTALLSDKPELSAALKEVAPLRSKFLPFFADGLPLGNSFLGEPSAAFVRGYQAGDRLLVVVLNPGLEATEFHLSSDLSLWLPELQTWKQVHYDGRGQSVETVKGDDPVWAQSTGRLNSLELAFFEIEAQPGSSGNSGVEQ